MLSRPYDAAHIISTSVTWRQSGLGAYTACWIWPWCLYRSILTLLQSIFCFLLLQLKIEIVFSCYDRRVWWLPARRQRVPLPALFADPLPAHSNVITWLTARPLGCSAFINSGSPQKGHVTSLWCVWSSTTSPQLQENTVSTQPVNDPDNHPDNPADEDGRTVRDTIYYLTLHLPKVKDKITLFLWNLYFLQVQMQYNGKYLLVKSSTCGHVTHL